MTPCSSSTGPGVVMWRSCMRIPPPDGRVLPRRRKSVFLKSLFTNSIAHIPPCGVTNLSAVICAVLRGYHVPVHIPKKGPALHGPHERRSGRKKNGPGFSFGRRLFAVVSFPVQLLDFGHQGIYRVCGGALVLERLVGKLVDLAHELGLAATGDLRIALVGHIFLVFRE